MKCWAPAVILLAMLLAPAMPGLSDGGGDYPPPASGDWVITQDTWVENETITLNGNISVIGANLLFRNVTMVGNLTQQTISVDATSSIGTHNCIFIAAPDGQMSFAIAGTAAIDNSSFLKGPGDGWGIWMGLMTPTVTVTDCIIEGLIECDSVPGPVLDGTRVQNNTVGARFLGATTYSGVTFTNCTQGALGGPDAVISNCTFENCSRGVLLSDRTRIEDSDFRNCTTGIQGWYYDDIRRDNEILGCSFTDCAIGFDAGWNSTVLGSRFSGCTEGIDLVGNASVQGCDFIGCGASIQGMATDILDVSDSMFTDNLQALNLSAATRGAIRRCIFLSPAGEPLEAQLNLSGKWGIWDSTLSGNGTLVSIWADDTKAVNTTFPPGGSVVFSGASLEVAWYLDATVLYQNGTPASGAGLRISDRSGNVLSSLASGPDGRTPRQEVSEYLREWNRTTYFTPLSLNATKDGLARNLSVNLNQNLDLSLTLGDVTAPWVRFTSPANNTLLNRTACVFSGTASDDQGVASVRLRAGSGDWVQAEGATEWSATLELAEGDNSIVAEAADAEGNTARALLTVRVDSLPPVVTITYPPQGLLVNATSIELTGKTEPGCTVLIDGEAAPFYLGQFSATVPLQEGPNEITVTARDAAGNVGSASVSVTRDTIPPALTLTSPQNGEVTGRAVMTVSGTAEPGARVAVNGADSVRSGPFFSTDIMLVEGVNTIHVQAEDAAGNQASITVRVIMDRTAPLIFLDLVNGTIVHSAALRLSGRTEPGAALSVNGAPVIPAPDGNFSVNLSLRPGPNQVRIEATDPAGNAASLDRTVTYEEPAAPRPPAEPDTGAAFNAGLVAGTVSMVIVIILFAWLFFQRRAPPPSDLNNSESGSLPAGRKP
jgi:hypothetical protein